MNMKPGLEPEYDRHRHVLFYSGRYNCGIPGSCLAGWSTGTNPAFPQVRGIGSRNVPAIARKG